MNLATITRAMGGDVTSGYVLAPGPGHSKHDRSMAVFLDPNSPDGFRVHSFAGDRWQDCRDHVKSRLGIGDWTPPEPQKAARPSDNADIMRTVSALAIWAAARALDGTVGLDYLARRGVDVRALPPIHHALRWHPACPWERGTHGAIIALFTDIITGEPKAIHRIAVTPKGEKVDKKMLGPAAGCVIRLWPDDAITNALVLGEGVETTLAAATRITHKATRLAPAWAAGSAGTMGKFPVLPGVEALTLLVDNDASGAGQLAALQCSARWTAAGQEVFRLTPHALGTDFADMVAA